MQLAANATLLLCASHLKLLDGQLLSDTLFVEVLGNDLNALILNILFKRNCYRIKNGLSIA